MKKIKLKVIFQNSLYHVKFQLLTSVFPVQIMLKSSILTQLVPISTILDWYGTQMKTI